MESIKNISDGIIDLQFVQKGKELFKNNGKHLVCLQFPVINRKEVLKMKEESKKRCELLIQNRDAFREAFKWEDGLTCLAGAGIFTMAGKMADVAALKQCKKIIEKRVSAFSYFVGAVRVPIAAILTESGREEQLMEQGLTVYKRLKKDFMSSSYLPMAAMMIAQMTEEKNYEELAVCSITVAASNSSST